MMADEKLAVPRTKYPPEMGDTVFYFIREKGGRTWKSAAHVASTCQENYGYILQVIGQMGKLTEHDGNGTDFRWVYDPGQTNPNGETRWAEWRPKDFWAHEERASEEQATRLMTADVDEKMAGVKAATAEVQTGKLWATAKDRPAETPKPVPLASPDAEAAFMAAAWAVYKDLRTYLKPVSLSGTWAEQPQLVKDRFREAVRRVQAAHATYFPSAMAEEVRKLKAENDELRKPARVVFDPGKPAKTFDVSDPMSIRHDTGEVLYMLADGNWHPAPKATEAEAHEIHMKLAALLPHGQYSIPWEDHSPALKMWARRCVDAFRAEIGPKPQSQPEAARRVSDEVNRKINEADDHEREAMELYQAKCDGVAPEFKVPWRELDDRERLYWRTQAEKNRRSAAAENDKWMQAGRAAFDAHVRKFCLADEIQWDRLTAAQRAAWRKHAIETATPPITD